MEPVGDPCRLVGPCQSTARQVEDQQVDRSTGEQAAGDAEPLVKAGRGDHHEPVEPDPAGDGLDRIEAARQVEPGHDRALRLGFRRDSQAERRPAARAVAADRDAGRLRQPAWSEDRVERRKARPDDAIVGSRLPGRTRIRVVDRDEGRRRCQGQRPDDPRSCGTPAGPEARDCGIHITPTGRHRTSMIEQMF